MRSGRARARPGLQAEVVASLALVMLAATALLAAVLLQHNEARLREWLGRGLRAEAQAPPLPPRAFVPGTRWWRLGPGGEPRGGADAPDAETRALARAARARDEALLRPGAPWEPIRFAAPVGPGGAVAAAELPREASLRLRAVPLALVAGLVVLDVALFTGFGAWMLRRRVVAPMERLAAAARALGEGGADARVPVEGPRETAALAAAFNDTLEALARRSVALEKAVVELRAANAELRSTRAGLDRAERLAAVGRLAAGVAHEVGNPMGALLAFLDLAQRDAEIAPATREHLVRASEQGGRVRRILRQLLTFSRPASAASARVPLDLAALADEAAGLVRAQARWARVRFEVVREGARPPALGDPGAVAQILLNLALNAADAALTAPSGGVVRLLIRPAAATGRAGEPASAAAARRAPDAVECLVADDGPGIAEEDRERIFDPFFTTKAPGEGTGLGLSNSLRLAEEQGGSLGLVDPPAGLRTAFALRLPAAPSRAEAASACGVRTGVRGATPAAGPPTGDETLA